MDHGWSTQHCRHRRGRTDLGTGLDPVDVLKAAMAAVVEVVEAVVAIVAVRAGYHDIGDKRRHTARA